jgi:hypothetical protein
MAHTGPAERKQERVTRRVIPDARDQLHGGAAGRRSDGDPSGQPGHAVRTRWVCDQVPGDGDHVRSVAGSPQTRERGRALPRRSAAAPVSFWAGQAPSGLLLELLGFGVSDGLALGDVDGMGVLEDSGVADGLLSTIPLGTGE